MRTEIVQVNYSNEAAVDQFMGSQPKALFFQGSKYRRFLKDLLGASDHSLVAVNAQGMVEGILPILVKDGEFGPVANSLPFFGSNGGIVASSNRVFEQLLEEFEFLICSKAYVATTLIENPLLGFSYSKFLPDFVDYRIGQFTFLDSACSSPEGLMRKIHHKTRNMVRKGQSFNFIIEEDIEAISDLATIHSENMRLIGGSPKTARFFDLMKTTFIGGSDFKIFVARQNNVIICALLIFYYNQTAEYFTPAVHEDFRSSQALSAVIFHAMLDAAARGFSIWNWGGTWASQNGVHQFKKRWGTTDLNYNYYTRLNDRSLLHLHRDRLLSAYPGFFTLPFEALNRTSEVRL